MQFKHPELLYALVALIIPIIIHLFQLRSFKKVPFTNVAFLQNVVIQTRKSAQLKKWLTLLVRLLLFAAIIIAFAQPYTSKKNARNQSLETVVYIDNSFSMQAKGEKGALLKRAIQDVISNFPNEAPINIFTNNQTFKDTRISAIKNELLSMAYSSQQMDAKTIILKSKSLFSKQQETLKNLIYISDFQNYKSNFSALNDTTLNIYAVKLQPVNTQNIAIDSAYISQQSPEQLTLSVLLSNSGKPVDNIPISLINDGNLLAKTSTAIDKTATVAFTIPNTTVVNGELRVNDTHLQFDNTLYFNINMPEKIKVLAVSDTDTSVLKRIYTDDEFLFTNTTTKNLNYNSINKQDVIVLYGLRRIPQALTTVLKTYVQLGGTLLIIPATDTDISSYNALLTAYKLDIKTNINTPKRVTTINYSHALYSTGVFEKRVKNFQFPKVNAFYNLKEKYASPILSFEDDTPFLVNHANVFLATASLDKTNSNFTNSPLIVPTFYNIAKSSFNLPQLYYTIGNTNSYDVKVALQQDRVLRLTSNDNTFIPKQHILNQTVSITTDENPSSSGIYTIMDSETALKNVSYNYDRNESQLTYTSLEDNNAYTLSNSVGDTFDILKSNSKINALWKWFVIFALILCIAEMLILKFFK